MLQDGEGAKNTSHRPVTVLLLILLSEDLSGTSHNPF